MANYSNQPPAVRKNRAMALGTMLAGFATAWLAYDLLVMASPALLAATGPAVPTGTEQDCAAVMRVARLMDRQDGDPDAGAAVQRWRARDYRPVPAALQPVFDTVCADPPVGSAARMSFSH